MKNISEQKWCFISTFFLHKFCSSFYFKNFTVLLLLLNGPTSKTDGCEHEASPQWLPLNCDCVNGGHSKMKARIAIKALWNATSSPARHG